jgi:hypothetical protein
VNDYDWFEVWADDTARPPYVLLLMFNAGRQAFDIYDPGEKAIRHTVSTYEDAMYWLTEDEYTKVDGRVFLDNLDS